jgi:hypothetical protein
MPPADAVSDALCVTLCLFELVLQRVLFKHLVCFRPRRTVCHEELCFREDIFHFI